MMEMKKFGGASAVDSEDKQGFNTVSPYREVESQAFVMKIDNTVMP